jgi:hypothetical protein
LLSRTPATVGKPPVESGDKSPHSKGLATRPATRYHPPVTLEVSTPALLFPAISLLFLSFTNRFLHLSALIRQLHKDWLEEGDALLRAQIDNLRRRLTLIRAMQLLGAFSLLLCVVSMVAVIATLQILAIPSFTAALLLMGGSLVCLCYEVWISGGALRILLNAVEERR